MSAQQPCLDDPRLILDENFCLSDLSKDLKGALRLEESKEQVCKQPECKTLKTINLAEFEVVSHAPCDSKLAHELDGKLVVERLVTAYEIDGEHRGFHAGDFIWRWPGGEAKGRMSGVTNEGTHRAPIFQDCQRCNTRGVMEGRLCGEVVVARDPALKGCHIVAAYRIKFDPTLKGASGGSTGVIEGVLICPCR